MSRRRGRGDTRRHKLRQAGYSPEWIESYLRDFGAFGRFVAKHFGVQRWKVDLALAKQLPDDWELH